MPINITMPALSPTMEKGNLVKWRVKVGDTVKPGTILAEIETDKAVVEFEGIEDGVVYKILVPEKSENVLVNTPIMVLSEKKDDAEKMEAFIASLGQAVAPTQVETQTAEEKKPEEQVREKPTESTPQDRIFISPLAKRIAGESNIDISGIQGTGPHQRIVKRDIEKAMSSGSTKEHLNCMVREFNQSSLKIPMSNMRKVIAKRLLESKQTIPHFYVSIDVDMSSLTRVREKMREKKITINDIIMKSVALSLVKNPRLNATFHEDYVTQYKHADVCVAVALEDGLITPIVKAADAKFLQELSLEVKDLAKRAKEGKLKPEEFQGGTFTISNMGMLGVTNFQPIINPPQVGILGIGTVRQDGLMTLTLSCDHRAVDGADGASFLRDVKTYLEDPILLFL